MSDVVYSFIYNLYALNNWHKSFHALFDDKQMQEEFARYARFYGMIHI